jgi:hypothetical protein
MLNSSRHLLRPMLAQIDSYLFLQMATTTWMRLIDIQTSGENSTLSWDCGVRNEIYEYFNSFCGVCERKLPVEWSLLRNKRLF